MADSRWRALAFFSFYMFCALTRHFHLELNRCNLAHNSGGSS